MKEAPHRKLSRREMVKAEPLKKPSRRTTVKGRPLRNFFWSGCFYPPSVAMKVRLPCHWSDCSPVVLADFVNGLKGLPFELLEQVMASSFSLTVIQLKAFPPPHSSQEERCLHILHSVQVPYCYMDHTAGFRKSNQLFLWCSTWA
ncbi:uncharacterized protein AKAME5_001443300 [Lates japonicus]|uniref:Uncharacterized protein n=1 Tax=Lates japonicus TaxID=270547 RepID=A0AAD3RBD8_LATJO|nr:uncharacterized protein AKAME5_001443300 [Lates japonicus]